MIMVTYAMPCLTIQQAIVVPLLIDRDNTREGQGLIILQLGLNVFGNELGPLLTKDTLLLPYWDTGQLGDREERG